MTGPRHADRPQHTVHPDELEVAPGFERASFEGWIPELATDDELREALEKAFDYRGDITVRLADGTKIEGYIFDRRSGSSLEASFVRLLPRDSSKRVKISYRDIRGLEFSGRDTAAGKSWEAWIRKYWEKRERSGERLSLEPERLGEERGLRAPEDRE